MMKIFSLIVVMVLSVNPVWSQSYNQEKITLTNFLVRMYKSTPFEGVKVVADYENNYLVSVVLVKTIPIHQLVQEIE